MNFIIHTTPEELKRARQWWDNLDLGWKWAFNEAVFGQGPVDAPPHDDALMMLLIQVDTLRFAGPLAPNPNVSNPVTNLKGLIPLYQLKYLSLTHMQLRDTKDLQRHTQLEHLFLYDNQLTSIAGLQFMSNLKALYIQDNRIQDLSPIQNLTNLETLYVTRNQIKHLDAISLAHKAKLKQFYVLPNQHLPDEEIIRVQHQLGILCRQG